MGQYNSAVLTSAGLALIAEAAAGTDKITFPSAQTSSYAYPSGTDLTSLTALQDVVQTEEPTSVQVFNNTVVQASVRFDNSQVTETYLIQTLGLFAQLGDGDPVLFSVVTANTPDQMPAQSTETISSFIYNIQTTVQQATSIAVTVNPAGTATVQDLTNQLYDGFDYSTPGQRSLDAATINTATPLTTGDFFSLAKGNYIAAAGLTNAPNSTDGFFVRVTVDGTQKIIQAMVLGSLQEFVNYFNGSTWTGWFDLSTRLSVQFLTTSLTAWAASLPNGKFGFSLGGDSYSGNDLPSGNYWKYGNGVVIKRLGNSGTLILCDNSGNISTRALAAGVWSDWDSVVMGRQIQGKYTEVQSLSSNVTFTEVGYVRSGNVVLFKGYITVKNASSNAYVIANVPKSINSGGYQTQFFQPDIAEVTSSQKRLALEVTPQGTMTARFGEVGKSYVVMYTYICED